MSVSSKQKLLAKLRNKEYRDAYVVEHVKTSVPIQIRTLREQHGFTQSELARRAGMTQTVISRLEDPNYGNLTINSLLKVASGLDVALLVKFVPLSRLLDEFKDVSPEAIAAESFDQEINKLEQWATAEPLATAGTAIGSNVFHAQETLMGTWFSFTVTNIGGQATFTDSIISNFIDVPQLILNMVDVVPETASTYTN